MCITVICYTPNKSTPRPFESLDDAIQWAKQQPDIVCIREAMVGSSAPGHYFGPLYEGYKGRKGLERRLSPLQVGSFGICRNGVDVIGPLKPGDIVHSRLPNGTWSTFTVPEASMTLSKRERDKDTRKGLGKARRELRRPNPRFAVPVR